MHKNGKVAAPVVTTTKWLPLVKADQATVARVWPRVRLGCLAVKARWKRSGSMAWTPNHIRQNLDLTFQGRSTAELWQIMDRQGEMRGFLVTITGNCPYLNIPQSLIVWVAYTFRPIPAQMKKDILAQLEEYTRQLGLNYVDGYSSDIAWIKWLDRYGRGYSPAQYMFRKEVWRE